MHRCLPDFLVMVIQFIENSWFYTFCKSISTLWIAKNLFQDLNLGCPFPLTITITLQMPPYFYLLVSLIANLIDSFDMMKHFHSLPLLIFIGIFFHILVAFYWNSCRSLFLWQRETMYIRDSIKLPMRLKPISPFYLTICSRRNPCGVTAKVVDCSLKVSKFELQLCYYIHFQTYTLRKVINPLIPLVMS